MVTLKNKNMNNTEAITPLVRFELLATALKGIAEAAESECIKLKSEGTEPTYADLEKVKTSITEILQNLLEPV